MAGHCKAPDGHRVAIAALFACLIAAPAMAETVPLPTPRPLIHRSVTATVVPRLSKSALEARAQAPQAQAPQAQAPNPISNPFAALLGKPGSTTALSPEQRAIIDKVNKYLSATQTLDGNFVQVGPDGKRTQGEFYIQKPGRVRFDYDPPSPIDIVADGQSVVVRDRNLATQDSIRCRRRRCAFCSPTMSICSRTPTWSRSMPTTCSSP